MLRVLDLFSGIGGFSLGLERAGGFRTDLFCERDPYCQAVLKKHWPGAPVHDDVNTLTVESGQFDVVCGGFPCQDVSLAGKGQGLRGARSGLWKEMHRLIEEARPSWVIVENVSALRRRGLDQVLRQLDEIGYDAEWNCVPASAVGAPHQRDRIWVVAYPHNSRGLRPLRYHPDQERSPGGEEWGDKLLPRVGGCSEPVADPVSPGWEGRIYRRPDPERETFQGYLGRCCSVHGQPLQDWWQSEPNVGRVAHGVPSRVVRLRCLGNAIVPQIAEAIGLAILRECHEEAQH